MPKNIVSDESRRLAYARNRYQFVDRILRLSIRALPKGVPLYSITHWRLYDELFMQFDGGNMSLQFAVWAAAKGRDPDSRDMTGDEIARVIHELPPKVRRQYLWFVRRLAAKIDSEG